MQGANPCPVLILASSYKNGFAGILFVGLECIKVLESSYITENVNRTGCR